MWLFTISTTNGKIIKIEKKKEDGAEELFRDLQQWINEPDKATTPYSVTIKSCFEKYNIIVISKIETVEVSKIDSK